MQLTVMLLRTLIGLLLIGGGGFCFYALDWLSESSSTFATWFRNTRIGQSMAFWGIVFCMGYVLAGIGTLLYGTFFPGNNSRVLCHSIDLRWLFGMGILGISA